MPMVGLALAKTMPFVGIQLAKTMPFVGLELAKQAPFIAAEFVRSLISEVPKFIQALIDGIKGAFDVVGDIGQGAGNLIGDIGGFFGFQQGGIVPGVGSTDSVPARLTPGELVVDRETTQQLKDFLNSETNPQAVTINLTIEQEQLANVLLNLDRQGFRTAS